MVGGSYGGIIVIVQRLAAGEDPIQAFRNAADAALAGAAATKSMQAQVTFHMHGVIMKMM